MTSLMRVYLSLLWNEVEEIAFILFNVCLSDRSTILMLLNTCNIIIVTNHVDSIKVAPKRIELQKQVWSHLKDLFKSFQMRPSLFL